MRPLFDAHNHLQDPRFAPVLDEIVPAMQQAGVERCVVNGTGEDDWPRVAELAQRYPGFVQPSFGLHPWKASTRSAGWLQVLTARLEACPSPALGECGLDGWIENYDLEDQRAVFLAQLELAAARDLPLSIHCLKAWGPLLDCLRTTPRPARGFLLHSYGGSRQLVSELVSLGAYFSFSGSFLRPNRHSGREAFQAVPLDRLLVETDAPDMLPPPEQRLHPLLGSDGKSLNHPANLPAIAANLAEIREESPTPLVRQLEDNFRRFFGP